MAREPSMTWIDPGLFPPGAVYKSTIVSGDCALIVRTTIELGHSLGLKVVAEGIETPEVWTALLRLGCDLAQGYYISRPMPAGAVSAWVRSQREQLARNLTAAEEDGRLTPLRGRPA